jgi:outer membrane receptor protein involved in Fe transport
LFIPYLYDISNSLYQPYLSNARIEQKGNALFAAGEIEYKKFVSASWSLREDWNSTLPETNNHLFSPSAGLALIPTDLIKAPSWLSFAKIYGSWGKRPLTLGFAQTNTSFSIGAQWNGNFSMTAGDVIPDENLKGGLITSYEAGIDMRMLKYRLGVNINYYSETASDQPIQINIDAVSGFTTLITNIANVKRQGLELTADVNILKSKNVSWNLLSSFGWLINNPVTKIIEGQERVQPYGWKSGLDRNAFASAYEVLGQNWGQLIGGGFTRNEQGIPVLDPSTGLYVTADNNHDWGSIVPKITGGMQSIFSYKGVTFNFSIDYQFGGKYYSASEYWGAYSGDMEYTSAVNDRGKNIRDPVSEGGGVHVAGVSAIDNKTPVDMYVDAFSYFHQYRSTGIAEPYIHGLSYVKLRELSLGYDLPLKKWHFADKYLQAIKVSLIARNPWLIYSESKYFDPSEISYVFGEEGQLPSVRSYGFNLNLTF